MGFLDHSTNNIIVDAVLTDTGREFLAANRGDFKIAYFSLSDDEVDYTIIERFGRSVGKEKIIKNTPIFEAQTIGTIAQKHRMLSLPDPTITRLPTITLSVDGGGTSSTNVVDLTLSGDGSRKNISVNQTIQGQQRVPDGVADVSFTVEVSDRFVSIQNKNPFNIEASSRIASYTIQAAQRNNKNGAQCTFTIEVQQGLDIDTFRAYSSGDKISSVVAVIGNQSGYRTDFSVNILNTSS